MNRTNDIINKNELRLLLVGLSSIFLLMMLDVVSDLFGWFGIKHVVIEAISMIVLFLMIVRMLYILFASRKKMQKMQTDIRYWQDQHKKVLAGLSETIAQQFNHWQLTEAQKQIALLMLKGLSFKEIAQARSTSERTVRQQATELYKKSDLSGRHEFAAFFLEDLLLPTEQE